MAALAMLPQSTLPYGQRGLRAVTQAHDRTNPLLPTCRISIPTRARCANAAIKVGTPGAKISSVARKGQQTVLRLPVCVKVSCLDRLICGCATFSVLDQQLLHFPSDNGGTLQYVVAHASKLSVRRLFARLL